MVLAVCLLRLSGWPVVVVENQTFDMRRSQDINSAVWMAWGLFGEDVGDFQAHVQFQHGVELRFWYFTEARVDECGP